MKFGRKLWELDSRQVFWMSYEPAVTFNPQNLTVSWGLPTVVSVNIWWSVKNVGNRLWTTFCRQTGSAKTICVLKYGVGGDILSDVLLETLISTITSAHPNHFVLITWNSLLSLQSLLNTCADKCMDSLPVHSRWEQHSWGQWQHATKRGPHCCIQLKHTPTMPHCTHTCIPNQ